MMNNGSAHYCQSCGMPLDEARSELIGKEKNGNNSPYCVYCYRDGVFTNPDATLDNIVEESLPHLTEKMSEKEARAELYSFLPRLARWAK